MIPSGTRYAAHQEAVLGHLWRTFPHHCVILADPQMRRVVDLAVQRAAAHGFYTAAEVSSWASLMVYLGSYFDEDPLLPWSGEALRASAGLSRSEAMRLLYARTNEVLQATVGPLGEYYRHALLWANARTFAIIAQDSTGSVRESLARWLSTGYPSKYESLSAESLAGMQDILAAAAQRYGIGCRPGAIVYAGLMFLLGSFIDRDPLHPWAGEVLADASLSDPVLKAEHLHRRAVNELQRYMRLDNILKKG